LTSQPLKALAAKGETEPSRELESAISQAQQGIFPGVDQPLQTRPAEDVSTKPLYQAAQAVEKSIENYVGPENKQVPEFFRKVAGGFGSVGASVAAGAIPGIGPGLMAAGGQAEAVEKAIQNKATPEQQATAGQLGTLPGMTDLADVLLANLGSTGKALGLVKRVGLRAVEGAITEGGQEGLQQAIQNWIAKGIYKPDQDILEDVPESALIGAIVGAHASAALGGHDVPATPQPGVSIPTVQEVLDNLKQHGFVPPQVGDTTITTGDQTISLAGPPLDTPTKPRAEATGAATIVTPEVQPNPISLPVEQARRDFERLGAGAVDIASRFEIQDKHGLAGVAEYDAERARLTRQAQPNSLAVPMSNNTVDGQATMVPTGATFLMRDFQPSVMVYPRAIVEAIPAQPEVAPLVTGFGTAPAGTSRQALADDQHGNPVDQFISAHSVPLKAWLEDISALPNADNLNTLITKLFTAKLGIVVPDVMVHVVPTSVMERWKTPGFTIPSGVYITQHPEDSSFPKARTQILIDFAYFNKASMYGDMSNHARTLAHVVLHEAVHAATSRLMITDKHFALQMRMIVAEVKQRMREQFGPDIRNQNAIIDPLSSASEIAYQQMAYALEVNEREFIAEALSNPRVQHILANMKMSDMLRRALGLSERRITFWQAVSQMLHRALGLEPNLESITLLEAAMRVGTRIIDAQARLPGDAARPANLKYVDGYVENQRHIAPDDPGVEAVGFQPETIGPMVSAISLFGGQSALPPGLQQMRANADKMNWIYKWFAGLDQLAQANPNFAPLLRYVEAVRDMHIEESKWHDAATRVSKDWLRLGTEGDRLSGFIDEVMNMTYLSQQDIQQGNVRHPSAQELARLETKYKITGEGRTLFNKINLMTNGFLDNLGQSIRDHIMRSPQNAQAQAAAIAKIAQQIAELKKRPYFPFMHFGDHYVAMKDPKGNMIRFETIEKRGPWSKQRARRIQKNRYNQLQKDFRAQYNQNPTSTEVYFGVLPESAQTLLGLPAFMLEHMGNTLQLTPEQINAIPQLAVAHWAGFTPTLKIRSQRKFFQPGYAMYTKGYSQDMRRAFARYFFHGAKFYSRGKYLDGLKGHIEVAKSVTNDNKANEIAKYMSDHLQNTIIHAKGDFGFFRGAIFFWAMGYVPAAATQNLSQTPLITFPYLTAKFGSFSATRELVRAMKVDSFQPRDFYTRNSQTAFEYAAMDYGIKSGRITEAQASDLAGLAQGNNLIQGIAGNAAQRGWIAIASKAAWFFEHAEQFNRRVAFRAALNLALKKPNSRIVQQAMKFNTVEYANLQRGPYNFTQAQAQAIVTANYVTEQTQYTYAKEFRPRFMRGPLGATVFVFKKYIQSTLFMLGQNPDVLLRYLLISALIGGLGNLPYAEDISSMIRAIWGYFFKQDVSVERAARKWITELSNGTVPADIVLHGIARRGFGLPALLDLMGSFATGKPGRGWAAPHHDEQGQPQGFNVNVPFPVLDRSKAIGMGPILPVDPGKMFNPTDVDKTISEQAQKASGAVFSVGFNIYKGLVEQHLSWGDPKRWEKMVPRGLADASKSFRAFYEGRERTRGGPGGGSTVVSYDIRDTEQMMEALAIAAGYQPLRVQAKWDLVMAQQEVTKFWDQQRSALMEQLYEAHAGRRPEEINKTIDAIQNFNDKMKQSDYLYAKQITSEAAKKSVEAHFRARQLREAGVPAQKTNIPIAREMQRLYPESTVDVRPVR